jgi:hypothetical protein
VETKFGALRMCDVLSVTATNDTHKTLASTLEELQKLLHLPESNHSLDHWYCGSGGLPSPPTIEILDCDVIKPASLNVTGEDSREPHICCDMKLKLKWKVTTGKFRKSESMVLPTSLTISITTNFAKMMWNCDNEDFFLKAG